MIVLSGRYCITLVTSLCIAIASPSRTMRSTSSGLTSSKRIWIRLLRVCFYMHCYFIVREPSLIIYPSIGLIYLFHPTHPSIHPSIHPFIHSSIYVSTHSCILSLLFAILQHNGISGIPKFPGRISRFFFFFIS